MIGLGDPEREAHRKQKGDICLNHKVGDRPFNANTKSRWNQIGHQLCRDSPITCNIEWPITSLMIQSGFLSIPSQALSYHPLDKKVGNPSGVAQRVPVHDAVKSD